ncbi:hypothetical protein Terro_3111 [Terriglobus roseus DSM 18391]|uniref:Uncharacterized protein n=1 Tax=Terriglobus roseus (strain DSM 18391 / NRRL B-41598 / KBS 63) TaxID=926566 RepID=I3ZJC3_TERRK|nr:hypothetical protein [Terriglobus roseus]AFL89341.1 hypothetical protein Terro_3111 [Terriglobus roseus DSM 18391]
MADPETIAGKMEYLLPGSSKENQVPFWPPDVFCLCAAILQNSGAYSRVLEDNEKMLLGEDSDARAEKLRSLGKAWTEAKTREALPNEIGRLWGEIYSEREAELNRLGTPELSRCRSALLDLLALADEASVGLGINSRRHQDGDGTIFKAEADRTFVKSMTGQEGGSLCKEIHPSRARVLPKMHTPQSGLTIRSLSHHLGYCPGSDMQPYWYDLTPSVPTHCVNLLLIPWPMAVEPSQFASTKTKRIDEKVGPGGYGLFTYKPGRGPTVEYVRSLLSEARRKVGPIGGIVFPELAMSEAEFDQIARVFATPDTFVVAGVGEAAGVKAGKNKAMLEVVNPDIIDKSGDPVHVRIVQKKHHRWKLDKPQIVQYGLGANLHPLANWWENIELGDRQITFVALQSWLTMSVLICEDLARPDPVGDIVRAVGPNLIIALLCDGPQIGNRWPGRYASGFADDPGSSVLTFTNLGMSKLSRASDPSKDRSGVVALWRDAKTGTTELSCPSGSEAIVLNVTAEYHEEWTADGRGDGKSGGYPVLSGFHPIKRPDSSSDGWFGWFQRRKQR